ncbi:MAG: hypothetical protein ACREVQ_09030 [Burkholderiales bacterium]
MRAFNRVVGLAALLLALSFTAQAQAPDALELEFWKSADRIGTEAAYTAYLARYPSGAFAPLAKAAMDKLRPGGVPSIAAPAAAAATTANAIAGKATPRATLSSYSGDPNTGAGGFQVGDRFYGPGTIQVGRIGSRKQIVIPNGEWVGLTAVDRSVPHGSASVLMVSAALGQFDGRRLRSLLIFDTNSWSVRLSPQRPIEWGRAADCERNSDPAFWKSGGAGFPVRSCARVDSPSSGAPENAVPNRLWSSLLENLSRLEADTTSLSFNVQSVLYVTDNLGAFLEVTRYDCVAQGGCNAATPKPPENAVASRVAWARAYVPLAIQGFRKKLDADELEPSVDLPTRRISLPD